MFKITLLASHHFIKVFAENTKEVSIYLEIGIDMLLTHCYKANKAKK